MRFERWTRFAAVLAVVALSAAACDELGTDPVTDFDPEQSAQAMESMVSAVDTAEMADAYGSLAWMSDAFMVETPALLMDVEVAAERELAAAVIPSELFGMTFEWNETEMAYVPSDATGAPADGIRVIYYAIDPTTDQPASPLNALGYVELRDQSTEQSDIVALKIVKTSGDSDVTLADYTMELSYVLLPGSATMSAGAVGFISNGTDQLNFDVSQSMEATETLITIDQSYSMDLEGTDNAIAFEATMTADPSSQVEGPATMVATATITNGTQTVVLDVTVEENVLDGSIATNGVTVALIGGNLDEPTFTDADGNALTQQERLALYRLWDGIGEMFDFVEGILSLGGG